MQNSVIYQQILNLKMQNKNSEETHRQSRKRRIGGEIAKLSHRGVVVMSKG